MLRDAFASGLRGSDYLLSPTPYSQWPLLSQVYYRATTPLPAVIADFYRIFTDFLPIFRTFLGELDSRLLEFHQLVIIQDYLLGVDHFIFNIFHGVVATCTCFFSGVPRIEELQDPDSSPRREEVGRRTLRGHGGFLLPFLYRASFTLVNN